MSNKLKALGLAAVVAAAVMVPLYGAPESGAVEHGEWARMLLRALDMERAVGERASDVQLFSTLSWKNSLAFKADAYLRGEGVEVVGPSGAHRVVATSRTGEVAYPLAVVSAGDYRLRVRMAGEPGTPVSAEIDSLGGTNVAATFSLAPPATVAWVDAGATHLDPGAYTASVLLPAGVSLDGLEVAPPCVEAIEPIGGWHRRAITQSEDVAVTALKALDLEAELPGAAPPVEVEAGAATVVDLPQAGLYTVSVLGVGGGGQSWKADACRKAIWCPDASAGAKPEWHVLMTAPFSSGRHAFTARLGAGASAQRLRVERKSEGAADYVAALRRVGFDVGPSGAIPRPRAVEAMRFIERRRSETRTACGDIPAAERLVAQAAPIAGGFTGNPPALEPLVLAPARGTPLIVEPIPPTGPEAPTPSPTPPNRPRPAPTSPPPTIPPQPEGSPVLPISNP